MIQVPNATMELRFKKSMPKIITNINQNPNGKITLQQKFVVQNFDENDLVEVPVPEDLSMIHEMLPPQVIHHVKYDGQGPTMLVPKLVGMNIQWMNIPAVGEEEPDVAPFNMPT